MSLVLDWPANPIETNCVNNGVAMANPVENNCVNNDVAIANVDPYNFGTSVISGFGGEEINNNFHVLSCIVQCTFQSFSSSDSFFCLWG